MKKDQFCQEMEEAYDNLMGGFIPLSPKGLGEDGGNVFQPFSLYDYTLKSISTNSFEIRK